MRMIAYLSLLVNMNITCFNNSNTLVHRYLFPKRKPWLLFFEFILDYKRRRSALDAPPFCFWSALFHFVSDAVAETFCDVLIQFFNPRALLSAERCV